ncbi:TRAP transporter substrate-binding protein [Salipiger sp.]|uniref:TRAP transporter substrate-binding protein n=1 Tax=Salipiger sp. TaxID=2078585 RepID=UPI003A985CBC
MRTSLLLGLTCAAALLGSIASAQDHVMRIASGNPADPLALPASASLTIFEQKVEEYTNGRVDVQIFPDGQLGDQLSGLQQVKSGELQGSELAMGVMSNLFPKITFTDLPYVIPDMAVAQKLYTRRNPMMKEILTEMEDTTGVGIMFFMPQAYRQLTTKGKQVKTVDDLKGVKVRTMQVRPHIEMFNAAGAQATPVPWLEVYSSLQTGVVDGQENPLATIRAMNFQEVQNYITLTRHVHLVGAVTYNVAWFESLEPELQVAIMKAGEEASVGAMALAPVKDVLDAKWLTEQGVEIYTPTAEEIEGFKSVLQPPAFAWFDANVEGGAEVLKKVTEEIDRLQGQFGELVY